MNGHPIVTPAVLIVAVAIGFLLGSIPFGYLIGRIFYGTDIRAQGSGNIGAMNALRTFGRVGAATVLILDGVKGLLPVLLAARLFPVEAGAISALPAAVAAAAVLGHCFSPWLGFKGGKGVATSFGAIFGLSWKAGLIATGGWVLGASLTGYSSVGSMLGNLLAPFALWILTVNLPNTLYGAFAAVLIAYTHRENIVRLATGRENRIPLGQNRKNR
ncbi:MAG: glycerol-3-phosphate 1-O-acyltransferase PlsY [Vulcanimicrobiaceae bacterium]